MGSVSGELTGDMTPETGIERRLSRYLRSRGMSAGAAVFRDGRGRLRGEIDGIVPGALGRDTELLNKLSAAAGVRLCGAWSRDNGKLSIMEAEPLAATLGTASTRKTGTEENGDRSMYFKTDDGILYVILSDGMGSGPEAARDSRNALRALADFLKAGAEAETALKILNGSMLLQNSESTVGATVDMIAADLFSGQVRFFKLGAAASYVRRGKNIRKIPGGGLSAGLDDDPELMGTKISLGSGGMALMISDGVCPDGKDLWLREALAAWDGREPKEFALGIINKSAEKYGAEDDATVIAVAIDERG
jgi:stage II sporulation protein E